MTRALHPWFWGTMLVLALGLGGCTLPGTSSASAFGVKTLTAVQGADEQRAQSSPPDAQIAAGPSAVMQATNGTITIYDRSGKILKATTPEAFFGLPQGGSINDPQLFYDAHTNRFFAAEDALHPSSLYIAASRTSDPLKGWTVAHVLFESSACPDQPHLGMSNTVVAVGTLLFPGSCDNPGAGNPKADLVIVDKQALMNGNRDPAYDRFAATESMADFPLKDTSGGNNLYVVHVTDTGQPTTSLYMSAYQGVPPHGTFVKDLSFSVPTMASPPTSARVEPTNLHLDLDDDRPRSGIVVGSTAYVGLHDKCTPTGDTAARSCLRFLAVDLAHHTLIRSTTVAVKGKSLAYPAIAADRTGNVWSVATSFSPTLDPGILAVVFKPQLAKVSSLVTVQQGDAVIAPADTSSGSTVRYGDYSGASVDQTDPSTVWVTTEYGKSKGNWGTIVAHLGMG